MSLAEAGLLKTEWFDREGEIERCSGVNCSAPINIFWMMGRGRMQFCLKYMKYKQEVYYVKQCVTLK